MAKEITAAGNVGESKMPTGQRYRVLLVCSHPVQYMAPLLRRMAQDSRLEIQVAYCSLQGAESAMDQDFGREVAWDIPLLDGYPWSRIPNRAVRPGTGRFWGLVNPGLWETVRSDRYDAVAVFTGYVCASFWIAVAAAKASRVPVLFGTDAHELSSQDQRRWKLLLKKWVWPRLFRVADVVIVPSSGGVRLMRSLGIPSGRIALTPYTVDNDWWIERAGRVDRSVVRASWRIPRDAPTVLFCAKLQPWKRPRDILRAFARADVDGSYLVFAGDGPLRGDLEAEVRSLGLDQRVRFLGFVNQTGLPSVYSSVDLLVLPSEYEPFGVVVNEAMLCACPVVVSDRVGARFDLVRIGQTGFVFPTRNIEVLAKLLREVLPAREKLKHMGQAAAEGMKEWSAERSIDGLLNAIAAAIQFRSRPDNGRTL